MALIELIYTSLTAPGGEPVNIKDLLQVSQRNNKRTGVTGLLLFDGGRYIQILEGEAEAVETLFATIQKDPRHMMLELLHRGPVQGRSFSDWRMAYEEMPPNLLDDLAESMAVYALEMDNAVPDSGDSFGARLNGMFMDAVAAE